MDGVLDSRRISWSEAARFVLPAAGHGEPEITADAAFERALERGWLPARARAEEPVRLDGLSFLLMRSFALRGGLMYRLFPGPRYAYRELLYRRLFPAASDPSQGVSGELLFFLLNVFEHPYSKQESLEPETQAAADDALLNRMYR
jgi:hypothetical protein